VVAVPESTVVRASLVVYLIPVVCLLAGALLGNYLAPLWNIPPDLGAAGLGLVAMICAFLAARYLGGKTVAAGPKIVGKA
jgi:positive regulator of sigma E activity